MLRKLVKILGAKGCVAGIIFKNSKILLEKRSKKIIVEKNKWCLPGGRINFEEKAEDAIKREIKEEIGLNVKKVKFLFYHDEILPNLPSHSLVMVFLIEVSGKLKLNWEVSEAKWFSQKEIEKLDMAFLHKEVIKRFFKGEKQ